MLPDGQSVFCQILYQHLVLQIVLLLPHLYNHIFLVIANAARLLCTIRTILILWSHLWSNSRSSYGLFRVRIRSCIRGRWRLVRKRCWRIRKTSLAKVGYLLLRCVLPLSQVVARALRRHRHRQWAPRHHGARKVKQTCRRVHVAEHFLLLLRVLTEQSWVLSELLVELWLDKLLFRRMHGLAVRLVWVPHFALAVFGKSWYLSKSLVLLLDWVWLVLG